LRRETRIEPAGFDKIARSDFGQRNAVELARSGSGGRGPWMGRAYPSRGDAASSQGSTLSAGQPKVNISGAAGNGPKGGAHGMCDVYPSLPANYAKACSECGSWRFWAFGQIL